MATDNPLWGEERIANELSLKLGIRLSPRTVRKYMPQRPPGRPRGDQRWARFLGNHAKAIIACNFFVAVTVTFQLLYVFVLIHHGSRRLVHFNVTAHPTAAWTLQQMRDAVGFEQDYRYLLHDREYRTDKALCSSYGSACPVQSWAKKAAAGPVGPASVAEIAATTVSPLQTRLAVAAIRTVSPLAHSRSPAEASSRPQQVRKTGLNWPD